jgi:hypothetical protein
MCALRFARRLAERTGIAVKWNFELLLRGLFLLSLRKCDAILPHEWGGIRCQLEDRTSGQSFRMRTASHHF